MYLLTEGDTPFVLRRPATSTYQFVGKRYLDCIRDEESLLRELHGKIGGGKSLKNADRPIKLGGESLPIQLTQHDSTDNLIQSSFSSARRFCLLSNAKQSDGNPYSNAAAKTDVNYGKVLYPSLRTLETPSQSPMIVQQAPLSWKRRPALEIPSILAISQDP